jgi:catechol 2,3-dioxygenase-like lactoylglutathione lyase family enzyme
MSLHVHHLAVMTADLARAERFYAGVLGLRVVRRWDDAAGAPRSIWLELGAAFLAVEKAGADGPVRADAAPGWHCVALAIASDARATWRARLAAEGIAIERESDHTLYVRDPDRNLVGLSHWPEPCAPAPSS